MSAATAELFPGAAEQDARVSRERMVLAACLVVGRSLAGRGGPVFAMVEILRQCRLYADLVDGAGQ